MHNDMNGNKISNKIDLRGGAGLGVCCVKIPDKSVRYEKSSRFLPMLWIYGVFTFEPAKTVNTSVA